jgi:hypothetical protein
MMRSVLFVVLMFSALACSAQQQAPCGLTSMTETVAPVYPPIAKAAHVSGVVTMLATFRQDGSVETVKTLYGPPMLRQAAETFVTGWRANAYGGPRTCPVVVEFKLVDPACEVDNALRTVRDDLQHVTVSGRAWMFCDPAGIVGKRKRRFWIF